MLLLVLTVLLDRFELPIASVHDSYLKSIFSTAFNESKDISIALLREGLDQGPTYSVFRDTNRSIDLHENWCGESFSRINLLLLDQGKVYWPLYFPSTY